MKRVKWMLFDTARRMDRSALAGLALLAGAAVFYVASIAPARERVELLRREAAAAARGAQVDGRMGQRPAGAPSASNAAEFYQFFPSRQSAPEWLELIYKAAARQSLQLREGEYKLMPGKTGKLVEYQVSLPVTGSYAQIRKFVVQVLRDVPAASLDELVFRREAIGSGEVEAKIRLTLHMRSE